uniref:Major facilitator superfamily (MFS) profile domain-containing protein n=1 Tax=uncultured bacterium fosmid pJB84G2 TaxID=1478072 RepID=A0A0H3U8A6_9BACT|nr:hypothetical protein [uncultured bacterium fosmid pJB84G2]
MFSKNVSLDKRWKEVIFAGAGFGPNLLMVLMMAYFTDAVLPAGLSADINFWSYGGVTIVSAIVFPILWTIGRCFDGIVDVPLAALTDTLKNKTGKRFITVLISFLPMLVAFILCWIPVFGRGADITSNQQIGNTIWIFVWSIIFFASYTLALITFYGSLSEVCSNQTQRARVSAYKSVFDTISYALVYAAIPAIFKSINVPIWQVAIYASPLMLTILIPFLFVKKVDTPVLETSEDNNVPIGTSISLTLKSKPFLKWLAVNCISFFGLQMFLVSQNALISGVMNLGAGYAAILNTCAFAPVPIMLFFFNKLRKKKGIRFVYQSALLSFAIAIFSFGLGGQYIWGDQLAPKLIIGCIGGVIGSWGIGAFFMVPYLIPTVIASVEEEVTKKNHSAMYFAVQALATSIVGAVASSLVYNYLKLWTSPINGTSEWKCGVSLVPLIVSIFCIIGFFLCFLMPKQYSARVIYKDIQSSAVKEKNKLVHKKAKLIEDFEKESTNINISSISDQEKRILIQENKRKLDIKIAKISLEISKVDEIINYHFDETTSSANEEKDTIVTKESLFAEVCLFFLSGGLFGIINHIIRYKKAKVIGVKFGKLQFVLYILSCLIPFVSIYTNIMLNRKIKIFSDEIKETKEHKMLIGITSALLPLFMNVVALVIIDKKFNIIASK